MESDFKSGLKSLKPIYTSVRGNLTFTIWLNNNIFGYVSS